MAKKRKEFDTQEQRSFIKMPEPTSLAERMQARFAAMGITKDNIKVHRVERTHDYHGRSGLEIIVDCPLTDEQRDELVEMFAIKAFDPEKDTVTAGSREVKLLYVKDLPEEQPSVKLWTGKERVKRSKPKSDTPEFP